MEKESRMIGIDGIKKLLPHRPPLLLVDRVLDYSLGESIQAVKNTSISEPVFEGHFPGNPVFPGVYMLEGLAQTSAVLSFLMAIEKYGEESIDKTCFLTGVQSSRFKRLVVPGDVIHYHVDVTRIRGLFAWFKGTAKVDGELAAEAEFSARLGQPII